MKNIKTNKNKKQNKIYLIQIQSNLYIKGCSRELENVVFMSSCPLYTTQ